MVTGNGSLCSGRGADVQHPRAFPSLRGETAHAVTSLTSPDGDDCVGGRPSRLCSGQTARRPLLSDPCTAPPCNVRHWSPRLPSGLVPQASLCSGGQISFKEGTGLSVCEVSALQRSLGRSGLYNKSKVGVLGSCFVKHVAEIGNQRFHPKTGGLSPTRGVLRPVGKEEESWGWMPAGAPKMGSLSPNMERSWEPKPAGPLQCSCEVAEAGIDVALPSLEQ